MLHVAVNRRANVELLIASGTNDRLHGIIALTMRAIGDKNLHPDTGFMLEMLKKIFVDALGDLEARLSGYGRNYVMAPSPAPGESRVRVNMGDDPLGLFAMPSSSIPVASTQPSGTMNTQSQTMNSGTSPSNQFPSSPYSAPQSSPYGLGEQYSQHQLTFQQHSYPIQQIGYGSVAYGGSYSHPIGSRQGMLGAQRQQQQFETQQLQTSVLQQPFQQTQDSSSYSHRALAYKTVQQQHAGVQQVATQNGSQAADHEDIRSPFPLTSGHSTQFGYRDVMNQQQQQSVYEQADQPKSAGPPVETVTEEVVQNPAPPATDDTGIDARTRAEPSVEAAERAASTKGAPGSAEGRMALLESALHCDLPTYLVESVLENSSLSNVKDPASVKVHAVELLKLLCQDPGYGMKFQLILERIPAWKKYVAQDHSLFITGHDQKTDYFLTDGSSSDPMKLITKG
jgi:hypothetical protein